MSEIILLLTNCVKNKKFDFIFTFVFLLLRYVFSVNEYYLTLALFLYISIVVNANDIYNQKIYLVSEKKIFKCCTNILYKNFIFIFIVLIVANMTSLILIKLILVFILSCISIAVSLLATKKNFFMLFIYINIILILIGYYFRSSIIKVVEYLHLSKTIGDIAKWNNIEVIICTLIVIGIIVVYYFDFLKFWFKQLKGN